MCTELCQICKNTGTECYARHCFEFDTQEQVNFDDCYDCTFQEFLEEVIKKENQ